MLGDELALELIEELKVSLVLCTVHEWVVAVAELAGRREDLFHVFSELVMDWELLHWRRKVVLLKLWEEVICLVWLGFLVIDVDGGIVLPVGGVAGVEEVGAFLEEDWVFVGCVKSLDVVIFFG